MRARVSRAGSHCNCSFFGNAHVKVVLSQFFSTFLRKTKQTRNSRHKHQELWVSLCALEGILCKNAGIRLGRTGCRALTSLDVKRHVPVPLLLVCLRRSVALAFERIDVDHDRMGRVFYLLKCGDKSLDVVAVIDIQVVQAHRFEEVILGSSVGAAQLSKLVVHATVVLGDGHLVVVEDDDKVTVQLTSNVQTLKSLAAGHGSVADNGDDVFLAVHDVASLCQAKRQADRRGSVADFEEVMRGLGRVSVRRHRVVKRRIHVCLLATGEQLVRICLVRDVVNDMVNGRVEHSVERDSCLDNTKVWTKVAAVL